MQGPAGIFGSAILEVAIGLLFLYFLLSTICSTINEILAALFMWRAQHLEKALANLITDPDLLARVVNHPLIRSMGPRDSLERGKPRASRELEGKPSYIPSRTFTLALLHELAVGQAPTTTTATPDVAVTV